MQISYSHRRRHWKHNSIEIFIFLSILLTMANQSVLSRFDMQAKYKDVVTDQDENARQNGTDLDTFMISFLKAVHPTTKLSHGTMMVIKSSIEQFKCFKAVAAAKAFKHIETFALNLLDYPWRREFKTIKLYTGFWQLRIERHLQNIEPLFNKMGYRKMNNHILILSSIAPQDQISEVACECHLAALELSIYDELHRSVEPKGFNLEDVHACRSAISGDIESCVDWINQNCKPAFKKIQENFERSSGPGSAEFHGRRQSSSSDKGLSLNVGQPQCAIENGANSKGKKQDPRDSGYVSKPGTQEHPKPPTSQPENTVETRPTLSPNSSFEDFYVARTLDEHVAQTLKLVNQKNDMPPKARSSSGTSDEWDHVRQGLTEKYGKDYYSGARGDIVFQSSKDTGYQASTSASVMPLDRKSRPPSGNQSSALLMTYPPMVPTNKVAQINTGTGRRVSPQTNSPVTQLPQSCAQQHNKQMGSHLPSTGLETDSCTSDADIHHPPGYPAEYPLLGVSYSHNFSTFRGDSPSATTGESSKPSKEPQDDARSWSSHFNDLLESDHQGVIARRLYAADSNQSLNKDHFVTMRAQGGNDIRTNPQTLLSDVDPMNVYSKPVKRKAHTAPISSQSQRGPPPPVPSRVKDSGNARNLPGRTQADCPVHTAPRVLEHWQCPACTYANPPTSTTCGICGTSQGSSTASNSKSA